MMEKYIKCGESDAIMIVATKNQEAGLDIIADCLTNPDCTIDEMKDIVEKLSIALMALVDEEVTTNKVLKTQPLINLCKYLVQQCPELVLDDDTYYMRRCLVRLTESLRQNKDAVKVRDAFMEVEAEDNKRRYQIQIIAEGVDEEWIPNNKIQIFVNDEE
jgi:hypothetical protein